MNSFNIIRMVFAVGSTLALVSCASMVTQTQFKQYYGADLVQGYGGTKRTLNGIDIWENGEPNCKFRILGFIEDDVLENRGAAPNTLNILNVATVVSLSGRDKRLVATAKQHGADAIVYVAANRSFLNAGRYETNFRNQVKIVAIKYVEEVGYGLGDSREQIESHLGAGEPIPVEKIGSMLTLEEKVDFKGVIYMRDKAGVLVLYNKNKADLVFLMAPDERLTDEAIAGLLRFFSKGQEWKKTSTIHPEYPLALEWVSSNDLYFAVFIPEKGVFAMGNKQTIHLNLK